MVKIPDVMVALNGVQRSKLVYASLLVAMLCFVNEARACLDAGAGGKHGHIHNDEGKHPLGTRLYLELLKKFASVFGVSQVISI